PDIPSQICRVVMKAIRRMPDSRFQTAIDFAKDFELALYSISATRQLKLDPIDPDKTEQLSEEMLSIDQELGRTDAEPAYNTDNHDYARPTVFFEESISTGSGERLTSNTSDIGE